VLGDLLDRHVGIDTVLVEQVDDVGLQPLQRRIGNLPDMSRLAVHGALAAIGAEVEAELGGDDDLVAKGRQRLAEQGSFL